MAVGGGSELSHFTILTFPDEIGFAAAAAHLIVLLYNPGLELLSSRHLARPRKVVLTNLLTATEFGWVSLHDVHWTLKLYQNGFSAVS